jgi:hypothetical protein
MKKLFLLFLFLICSSSNATTFSDLKFSKFQFSDAQWDVGACMYSNTCNIYGLSGIGTTWNTGNPVTIGSTQYIAFTATGDANNPWRMKLYNSGGTVAQDLGVGKLAIQGQDTAGNSFFFFTNDNWNGTVFSLNYGFANSNGFSFTGIGSPTVPDTNTMASGGSTSPLGAGQTGGGTTSSAPTVTGTSTTNNVSSSSTTSNTNNVTVSRPTSTSAYSDTFVGTTTVTTTTTTPVTTTTYSDGSTTTSNGTSTTTSSTTYTITPTYGTAPTYSRTAPNTGGNSVYIKQVYAGSNPQVSVTQEGNNNAVTGTDSGWATVDGNGSIVSTKQYGQGNIIGVKMNAWGNNIDLKQQAANGGDVSNNILNFESYGNGNASTVYQQSNSNTVAVKMTYDINTVNITQKTGTGNASYATITGNWNTVNNTQNGANNLSIVNVSGDNNSATVNQTGSGHSTLLNLIGNKNTVSVTQTGTGDAYSLQQTCTNPAGCSVSVIRSK